MDHQQIVADWQEADRRADEAHQAISTMIQNRRSPTTEQFQEVQRLRVIASDKLQRMLASAKAAADR